MANRKTLENLLDRAKECADQDGYTSRNSTTMLTEWANSALREIYDELCNSHEEYNIRKKDFTLSGSEYLVPDDFYRLKKVFVRDSDNQRTVLPRASLNDLEYLHSDVHYSQLDKPSGLAYMLAGRYLYIWPDDHGVTGTLEIWYTPDMPLLEHLEDTVPAVIPVQWEDVIICDVAARILEREESDPTPMLMRKQAILMRIRKSAANRDSAMPKKPAVLHADWHWDD